MSKKTSNYPANIEEKLGFDKVKSLISKECVTDAARHQVEKLSFRTDQSSILKSLALIHEMTEMLSHGLFPEFPEDPLRISDLLIQSDKEGMMLFEDELQEIYLALLSLHHNHQIIHNNSDRFPEWSKAAEELIDLQPVIRIPQEVLDKEGKLRPDASPELWRINKSIDQKEKEVRKILQSKFELARKNGWAGDTEMTIRNERLVIPIVAEHKKKIPGFVHDDSQSGKFLYIEPIECFDENNALRELYLERKKEIENILRQVTARIAPYKHPLIQHLNFSVHLDTNKAKAVFSGKIRASIPQHVQQHADTDLINARHPILYLHLIKDNKSLVPLNFKLRNQARMLVISGPNAGGKSIALKTIGLLQYMYQCGLPVPCDPDSRFSVYNHLFIDIGDNQSLENNLSSYSSHLMNMKYFLEHADKHTLYLIDELGNGTDPAIGSSIAQSILELLLASQATGIVTTHFGNLKAWAGNTEGVVNGRMMYDLQHLEPLFVLELGKPGSSFALEVATKVGLDKKIIERVRKINQWKQHIDLDELLAENEKHKNELSDMKKRIEEREKVLSKLIDDYEILKQSLSENKQVILNEAKIKASDLLQQANKKIEQTIKVIQQSKAEKTKTKEVRKELESLKEEVKPETKTKPGAPKPTPVSNKPLAVGSVVRHTDHKVSGEILKIKKDQAQVLFGNVTMWMPLAELYNSQPDKKHIPKTATFNASLFEKQNQFRAELDLRGIRGEDAIKQLDDWLHDAHLLGMLSLKIVHGRGHGILRRLIIDHLRSVSYVQSFEHESEQLGGDGVTLVRIE